MEEDEIKTLREFNRIIMSLLKDEKDPLRVRIILAMTENPAAIMRVVESFKREGRGQGVAIPSADILKLLVTAEEQGATPSVLLAEEIAKRLFPC